MCNFDDMNIILDVKPLSKKEHQLEMRKLTKKINYLIGADVLQKQKMASEIKEMLS